MRCLIRSGPGQVCADRQSSAPVPAASRRCSRSARSPHLRRIPAASVITGMGLVTGLPGKRAIRGQGPLPWARASDGVLRQHGETPFASIDEG